MELSWIWEAILIFFVGTLILRIGGRKSISQMTISQTIDMIGLGSLLIQPVSGKGLIVTFMVASLLTIMMIISELLEFDHGTIDGYTVVAIDGTKFFGSNKKSCSECLKNTKGEKTHLFP